MEKFEPTFTIKKETYEDGEVEYVATPTPFNWVIGVGDTPEEAVESLCDALIAYLDYKME